MCLNQLYRCRTSIWTSFDILGPKLELCLEKEQVVVHRARPRRTESDYTSSDSTPQAVGKLKAFPGSPALCIRSQIQILIRYNFFQTEYFLLKFSGSLELFLKRSIPVSFCSKKLYLVTRNCRNFKNLRKKIAYARKNYLTHPQYIFWTKRHRIRASHREIWRFWKFEQKILSLKLERFFVLGGGGGLVSPPLPNYTGEPGKALRNHSITRKCGLGVGRIQAHHRFSW